MQAHGISGMYVGPFEVAADPRGGLAPVPETALAGHVDVAGWPVPDNALTRRYTIGRSRKRPVPLSCAADEAR